MQQITLESYAMVVNPLTVASKKYSYSKSQLQIQAVIQRIVSMFVTYGALESGGRVVTSLSY